MSLSVDIRKRLASFDLEIAFEVGDETLGFLGASGCGKSMTLRCIAGVETPDEGKIVVDGKTYFDSSARINLSAQKRKTALLFQNFQLFPNFNVEQNIAAGIDRSIDADERKRIVAEQIDRFQLKGFEKRFPAFLSGGQQQRVALARMLAAHPATLMLDEPFSALDAFLKQQLEQDLLDLFADFHGSIFYVSHDIDEAMRFCDRIAVVQSGRIVELGPAAELVSHPQSYAGMKLSGCKNISPAHYVNDHTVHLDAWDLDLSAASTVPLDAAYVGIRAHRICPASLGDDVNVFHVCCKRTSDSRFERIAMLEVQGAPASAPLLMMKVDTTDRNLESLIRRGDEVEVEVQPAHLLVTT